jgi:hypothetical protein
VKNFSHQVHKRLIVNARSSALAIILPKSTHPLVMIDNGPVNKSVTNISVTRLNVRRLTYCREQSRRDLAKGWRSAAVRGEAGKIGKSLLERSQVRLLGNSCRVQGRFKGPGAGAPGALSIRRAADD